jgi:uncharacterized YccA/Bax inhibitor family protein
MTVRGTAIKTGFLLGLCAIAAVWSWTRFQAVVQGGSGGAMMPWLIGAALGGFVLAMIISFSPRTAPFLSPVYAVLEGIFLGVLSVILPLSYGKGVDPGLAFQAAALTFGIAGAAFVTYASGVVRLGGTAMKMVAIATGGVAIYAIALMLCNGIFHLGLPNLWASASPLGIGFSILVIVLAAFNLVMDYQTIEAGAAGGAPKYMEWYGAFGLTVTMVWLYIEVLRLLSKLNRRD